MLLWRLVQEYWKILNKKNNRVCNVGVEEFLNHFKDVNNRNYIDVNDDDDVSAFYSNNSTVLDDMINAEEIRKAVKLLKNNKSPGVDDVMNEYIKSSLDIMLPLYEKLFNVVLDTGILPEAWLIGNI